MHRKLAASYLGLALLVPCLLEARGNARMLDGPLRFEAHNQPDPQIAARIARWVEKPESISSDADGRGTWIATDGEVVVVNGTVYRQSLGANPWVTLTPDGQWAAGGSAGVMVTGNFFPGGNLGDILRSRLGRTAPVVAALQPAPSTTFAPAASDTQSRPALAPQDAPVGLDVPIVVDTTPPTVQKIELILFPDDPARRRVVPAGSNVFVGMQTIGILVTMSEKMATAPRVLLQQVAFNQIEAPLQNAAQNPVFEYRIFPMGAPANNGPVKIEVTGRNDGQPPIFGTDEAGNPIAPSSPGSVVDRGFTVDTVPPDLRRVDISVPGNFRTQPKENAVLPKNGFPKEILVLVQDYNQPDDGSFAGNNVATDRASGVDFDTAGLPGSQVNVKLIDPNGREIKGVAVASPPVGLRLLLPDVYDVAQGIFPDTDNDGVADPIEGSYRIQVDLIDKAGNVSSDTVPFGEDTTPLPTASLSVSIRPVFSDPFPNPNNPIPDRGTAVKKLEKIEITSVDPSFDALRTTAELLTTLVGPGVEAKPMKVSVTRAGKLITLTVDPDQDGNGQPDFENPAPGPFLPPGVVDPRFGKNDGLYFIRVKAFDTAGNTSMIEKEILVDTTVPTVSSTFPGLSAKIGPDVRIVDAILRDPQAASGRNGAGVKIDSSLIKLRFLGNDRTPAQFIRGIVFLHTPNDSDPTQPDFNPDDHFPKILYQIVDRNGDSIPLPKDGTFDGDYEISVTARDRAGNEQSGITTFAYSSKVTTSTTGTTNVVSINQLRPIRRRLP